MSTTDKKCRFSFYQHQERWKSLNSSDFVQVGEVLGRFYGFNLSRCDYEFCC